jgi:hypothetical protein
MRLDTFLVVTRSLDVISCFLTAEISFWWCDVRAVERWMLKDAGDWVYTLVLCVEVGWFIGGGNECKLGGGRWKLECVGRQKGLCGSYLIRITSMLYIKSIRMFEDNVTSPEHAIVIDGGSIGGWVGGVLYVLWRMFTIFGLFEYFDQGSSAFLSCALTVRDFLLSRRCAMFLCNLPRFTAYFLCKISSFLAVMRSPCEILLFCCTVFVTICAYAIHVLKDVERYSIGRWRILRDGLCWKIVYRVLKVDLLDVAWFCVFKLSGSLAGEMNVTFVVVVGTLGDRRFFVHALHQVDMHIWMK